MGDVHEIKSARRAKALADLYCKTGEGSILVLADAHELILGLLEIHGTFYVAYGSEENVVAISPEDADVMGDTLKQFAAKARQAGGEAP